jgi:hypothetical protein
MRLKSLTYCERKSDLKGWSVSGFTLAPINLIVGKNATGKTRTLSVINFLGLLLSGTRKPGEIPTGNYEVIFEHEGRTLKYVLNIADYKVMYELFSDDDRVLLERREGGVGIIFHEKEGRDLEFQTPETDVAVVARRDTIQHSFLRPLGDWGLGVRHYSFGEMMGRNTIGLLVKDGPPPDPKNADDVVSLFRKGVEQYSSDFKNAVLKAMNETGYDLEDISLMAPSKIKVQTNSPLPITTFYLGVKERQLEEITEQIEISQGMFRALSVIIHLQYAIRGEHPSCILIDDIGEGLDFDRSCRLIDIIRCHVKDSAIQLVMSTNDRFVMNNVPLEEWSLLSREAGMVKVHNFQNSQTAFENFKFTGLNNFDFLAMDFINESEAFLVGAN